jgi:hypothetical protein
LAQEPRPGSPRQYDFVGAATYSPELDPVERIWHYLRSHWLANSVFRSLADIMDACEMAWNRFATDHRLIRSLCAVRWAPVSPAQWVAYAIKPRPGAKDTHFFPESYESFPKVTKLHIKGHCIGETTGRG